MTVPNEPVPPDQKLVTGKALAGDQGHQNVDIETARVERAARVASVVEQTAVDLAVKVALRDQHVDTVLMSHTQRLDQISGRVERIDSSMNHLDKKMDTFIAVGEAVAHKSISTRTFVMGVLAIAIPGCGYILTTILH